jgi:hypothetical protein
MSLRHILATAAVALSFAVPAHADEPIGIATQFGGVVVSSSEVTVDIHVDGDVEAVSGACTYAGQTTPDGLMQYEYGGWAASSSTSLSQPELTDVQCSLSSPAQGLPGELPTQTVSFEVACPLYTCATASLVPAWPVRPVVVCVDGYTVFGPTPVKTVSIIHACKTSTV